MTHYVLTAGRYSDYHIVAVCSDRAKAEQIMERVNKNAGRYDQCDIEEYEDAEPVADNLNCYCMNFETNTTREDVDIEYGMKGTYWENNRGIIWAMYVLAENEETARKIAYDRRAMLMAQKEGVV